MKFDRQIVTIILGVAIIISLFAAIWMPYATGNSSMDFAIKDENNNYHFEVNELIEFTVNDSNRIRNKNLVWHFGNGDTMMNKYNLSYRFNETGKYMVTLEIDSKFRLSKYIKVISRKKEQAVDSIPEIYGESVGYVGEELVFSSYGAGLESWFWEFGETGTVDAYDGQVIYVYRTPGEYTVKLRTNTCMYPIAHQIKILPLFEALVVTEPVDSLSIAEEDIRKRLQSIADATVSNKRAYYGNLRYLERKYTCRRAEDVIVIINGDKYNDLYSYCQGLHILEGKGAKTVMIKQVAIDTFRCLRRIEVTQNIASK
ncbi:MAG: PKD domain-containing protein [Bacteroidales bacterium]|nr:PKD domain-containing protein [Bacteroidales bacterium]